MDIEKLRKKLKKDLDDEKFKHAQATTQVALELARKYGCDLEKTETAALLHDCAKGLDTKTQVDMLKESGFETDLALVPKVLHGPCGAIVAKKDYGILDEEILDAIKYHSFGRPAMTLLEKIIFIADAIEPGRDYKNVEKLRDMAFRDINTAVIMSLEGTRQKVKDEDGLFYEGSQNALEYYLETIKIRTGGKYIVDIENMTHEGRGVARIENFVVFVDGALTGEKVEIEILYKAKKYAVAEVTKIIDAAKERVESFCKVYSECGGCSLQHLRYEIQLHFKQNYVKDCLKRIGGFEKINVAVARGMKFPYKYRNKVQYPVEDGKAGFYKRRSHHIVEHRLCAIQPDDMNDVMNFIKPHLSDFPFIRNVVFRYGTEGLMVVFVSTKTNPDISELVELIVGKFKAVKSIVVNYNKEDTNTILGTKNKALYGDPYITDKLLGMEYKISPNSFYQINKEQARYLYTKISSLAGLTGEETVYDLYCGIGSIGMHLARKAKKVVGVEAVKAAVKDARANARHNNVKNIKFVEGKAEDVADELIEKHGKPDVVIVDPPRKGCEEKLLKAITDMNPQKIIYVSCNPSTFARDLKLLCKDDKYTPGRVQPIDMFPFTSHVETVVLMSRVEK